MAFGCEVDDGIDRVFTQQMLDQIDIADIAAYERIAVTVACHNILETLEVAGIGQQIEFNTWSSGYRSSQ